MSKLYDWSKWVWHRISYWGDKLLTLTYFLLVGVFIISWKFSHMAYGRSIRLLNYVSSQIGLWRDARRHKRDWEKFGIRPELSHQYVRRKENE